MRYPSLKKIANGNLRLAHSQIGTILFSSFFFMASPAYASCKEGDCENGWGIRISNEVRYEGQFKNGSFSGSGSRSDAVTTITGEFENGTPIGVVEIVRNSDGSKWLVNWADGLNGSGELRKPDGMVYVGQFKGGLPHGTGTADWQNGYSAVGEWVKGSFLNGTFVTPDAISKGKHKNWLLDGEGILILANGDIYKGAFADLLLNGEGLFMSDQVWYAGNFEDGEMSGFGYARWENGDEYTGHWKNGENEGFGYLTPSDGRSIKGFFKDSRLLRRMTEKEINEFSRTTINAFCKIPERKQYYGSHASCAERLTLAIDRDMQEDVPLSKDSQIQAVISAMSDRMDRATESARNDREAKALIDFGAALLSSGKSSRPLLSEPRAAPASGRWKTCNYRISGEIVSVSMPRAVACPTKRTVGNQTGYLVR